MTPAPAQKQSFKRTALLSAFLLLACAAFVALGIWQLERLGWKRDLIARVDSKVHAPAVPAPSKSQWLHINQTDDEYRHVEVTGVFDHSQETYVYASTELGAGYWVLTPLKTMSGETILINRGFVPTEKKSPSTRMDGQIIGPVTVAGLLRLNEPTGTFLRSNVPEDDRWYSRDVVAIAAKRNLHDVAPYFIDAERTPANGSYPVGGLTQIKFPNSHMQYAITWFSMAVMTLGFLWFLIRNTQTR